VVFAAILARRLVVAGRALVERGWSPRVVASALAIIAIGPIVLASFPLLRSSDESPHAPTVAAALLDAVLFVVATAFVATFEMSDQLRARARRFGAIVALVVCVIGFGWLSFSQSLGVTMRSGGGLAAALVSGFERWTDRDGDGVGASFGGRDCDEGDPRIHPGADDASVDGIDQNCDDVDGPVVLLASTSPGAASPGPDGNAAPAASATAAPALPTKPNVLLVTLDTVRADHTSSYGYAHRTTPHLDELAKAGVVFEQAYATGSDTQRAIVPLVSGRRLGDTPRDRREWPTIGDDAQTLAERLQKAGYFTAAVTSFTWMSKERGFAQGFDRFETAFEEEHPERGTTGPHATRAARSIVEHVKGQSKPFFLWVHLFDAHERYLAHNGFEFGKGKTALYDGEIGFVDEQVGQILRALDASGQKQKTIVLVHGSHGEAFDEHGSSGHGRDLYQEVMRVPLVVAGPGVQAGARITQRAVSTLDLAPTILELAGVGKEGLSGTSLVGALGGAQLEREPVYARGDKRAMVIDFPMKLIRVERGEKKKHRHLLFDLAADPSEKKDLSDDNKPEVARLITVLEGFARSPSP
jgi:arylsulfatase A-like enzyme